MLVDVPALDPVIGDVADAQLRLPLLTTYGDPSRMVVHPALVLADCERRGREASLSAAILDRQSVRTADQKG